MAKEIRVYVEGGGDRKDTKAQVKQGFRAFLNDLVILAREKRIRFDVIACGSRNSTLDDFRTALRTHHNAFNILLVDSDTPVKTTTCQHLHNPSRNWDMSSIDEEQCHLMVQVMETWVIADINALEAFYGQGFNKNSIPKTQDIEKIDKAALYSFLEAATRMTQKGRYHKIRHGPEILKRVDVSKVRNAASHCERLFAILEQKINE